MAGQMQFTLMSRGASSIARLRAYEEIAPFDALYKALAVVGTSAALEDRKTMDALLLIFFLFINCACRSIGASKFGITKSYFRNKPQFVATLVGKVFQ